MSGASYRSWGIAFALAGVLCFSLRPILIKLSYAAAPVSPNTLLFLRMAISLPFFAAVGLYLRKDQPQLRGRDWAAVAGLGFLGYYAASFLDFIGLQYVGAGVGRLILFLYPTLVLLISFMFLQKRLNILLLGPERARMLGGSCEVESAPLRGTVVTLSLSLPNGEHLRV